MDSMNVDYGRVSGDSRRSRKRIAAAVLASTFVVAAVICIAVGLTRSEDGGNENVRMDYLRRWESAPDVVKHACSSTLYPELCVSSIASFPGLSHRASPMEILNAAVRLGIDAVNNASAHTRSLYQPGLDPRQKLAIEDCLELFDETLTELNETLSDLNNMTFMSVPHHAAGLETLLSGAITNQDTCLEGFKLCKGNLKQILKGGLHNISHLVSNSLAMVRNITNEAESATATSDAGSHRNRRLLSEFVVADDGFPSWMSAGDRRLLQASTSNITVNAVVAKDGSGHYTTIAAAVDAAPEKSKTRFVIHIKAGVYRENVEVHKKKINLMFMGDGKGVTVVTGNRNVADGVYTTFHSATVAVTGNSFIARDMTFENTAGPSKHQAVALRAGSDLSAFFRCSFKAYQDTLYVHSLRQFYRECDVHGTVDFIFGNAAVVLQNCNLYARKPMEKQKIMYTAQGRQDPNQNTGISIQNCRVTADSDLAAVKSSFQVYLGRPWKEYSRTVIMQSYLDDLIEPAGWLEWNGDFALSTLYYGEYMNTGPGAGTANRVKWPGYRVIKTATEASQFTVANFIEGDSWIPSTGVNYVADFT